MYPDLAVWTFALLTLLHFAVSIGCYLTGEMTLDESVGFCLAFAGFALICWIFAWPTFVMLTGLGLIFGILFVRTGYAGIKDLGGDGSFPWL